MLLAIAGGCSGRSGGLHQFACCNLGIFSRNLESLQLNSNLIGPTWIRNPISLFKSRSRFSSLMESLKPSLVICHDSWAQAIFGNLVLRKKIPFVRMLHTLTGSKAGLMDRISMAAKPSCFIANSYSTKASFESANPGISCDVCYPPCILGDKALSTQKRISLRSQLSVNPETKVILMAGRFEGYKGHRVLLKAVSMLPMEKQWECWIGADAQKPKEKSYKKALQVMSNALGVSSRVRWLGHIDSMDDFFAAADVYCQPNTSPESYGMTLVEAQAMGCPVVTTAFGGAMETVARNGKNILLQSPIPENVNLAIRTVLGF